MKQLLHPDLKNPNGNIVVEHRSTSTTIRPSGSVSGITVYRPRVDFGKLERAHINAPSWNSTSKQEALDQLFATAYAVELMNEWNEVLDAAAEAAQETAQP